MYGDYDYDYELQVLVQRKILARRTRSYERGEDSACGNPCGQEPLGCSTCSELNGDDYDY